MAVMTENKNVIDFDTLKVMPKSVMTLAAGYN